MHQMQNVENPCAAVKTMEQLVSGATHEFYSSNS